MVTSCPSLGRYNEWAGRTSPDASCLAQLIGGASPDCACITGNPEITWLDAAARKDISFEKPGDSGNNHHYWRALAATAVGVTASDDKLFRFGIQTYKQAIGEIDSSGAFPKEMARHENATHYQGFALEPLILIAEFATRQGIDLYGYHDHGRTLRDAIAFFGRAVDDPSLIKPYTTDTQSRVGSGEFAAFAFYTARFGTEGSANRDRQCAQESNHSRAHRRQHHHHGSQVAATACACHWTGQPIRRVLRECA